MYLQSDLWTATKTNRSFYRSLVWPNKENCKYEMSACDQRQNTCHGRGTSSQENEAAWRFDENGHPD